MSKGLVIILGARSDIGIAIAHRFAQEGYDIQLAARNKLTLDRDCSDINIRYNVEVTSHEFDVLDIFSHENFVSSLPLLPTVVVSVIGYMGKQKESEHNTKAASLVMRSNYEGPVNVLGIFANYFEERGSGTLIGISSVAGDRGRASNYVYGSAKAGFTTFLSGLRNRMYRKGIHVLTVKPGFVFTKMTQDLELPKHLTTDPKTTSIAIYKAYTKKANVIYIKSIWRLIIFIIRSIPEEIFKKTKL